MVVDVVDVYNYESAIYTPILCRRRVEFDDRGNMLSDIELNSLNSRWEVTVSFLKSLLNRNGTSTAEDV